MKFYASGDVLWEILSILSVANGFAKSIFRREGFWTILSQLDRQKSHKTTNESFHISREQRVIQTII